MPFSLTRPTGSFSSPRKLKLRSWSSTGRLGSCIGGPRRWSSMSWVTSFFLCLKLVVWPTRVISNSPESFFLSYNIRQTWCRKYGQARLDYSCFWHYVWDACTVLWHDNCIDVKSTTLAVVTASTTNSLLYVVKFCYTGRFDTELGEGKLEMTHGTQC